MRIATWNVNGLRARLEFLVRWLRERRPDLVGLQELKLTEEQFPHALFEAEGYRAVVHGQKAWNRASSRGWRRSRRTCGIFIGWTVRRSCAATSTSARPRSTAGTRIC